jgi:hypothetical protein
MVPAWENAFSKETNERAWRQGGFGEDGITMAPLWLQKKTEEGALALRRARSAKERSRLSAEDIGLQNRTFEFDKWLTNPYERSTQELEKELDKDSEGEDDEGFTSTRLPVGELQKLQCPANSEPAKKVRAFHDGIANLSAPAALNAACTAERRPPSSARSPTAGRLRPRPCAETYLKPELTDLMAKHLPDVEWKLVDEAKAHLAHFLEMEFNALKLEYHGRVIKIKFDAYTKLNKSLQEVYQKLYPGSKRKADDASEGATNTDKSKKSKTGKEKKKRHFGFGAIDVD